MFEESFSNSLSQTFVNMISPGELCNAVKNYKSNSASSIILISFSYLVGVAVWSGLLIASLSNIIRRRADNYKQGLLRYSLKKHIVILGRDQCIPILIKQLSKKHPQSKITIMIDEDVSNLHYALFSELDNEEEKNVMFFRGNRTSRKDLESLDIPFASEVYIFGQPSETDTDLKNLNCLNIISSICENYKRKPMCYVSLTDINAHALTRTSNVLTETNKTDIEFVSINFEESWAKIILVDNKSNKSGIHYLPLDRNGISEKSTQHVHLFIIGMSKMGESLALLAAHIAHYPNHVTKSIKTKITLVDEDIQSFKDEFCHKYESYFSLATHSQKTFRGNSVQEKNYTPTEDYLDIEWEFIESKPTNSELMAYLEKIAKDTDAILTLALCYESAEKNNNIALYLPDSLYDTSVQILTRQNISSLISRYSNTKYSNIKPFGMTDEGICVEMDKTETFAKELNFNYAYGRIPESKDKKEIEKEWRKLPVVKKWSNLYSAMSIPTFWRSISCTDNYTPIIMSEVEHNRWNTEELLLGYRPVNEQEYADVCKKPELKKILKNNYIHFDIRPFNELVELNHQNVIIYDAMKIDYILNYYNNTSDTSQTDKS